MAPVCLFAEGVPNEWDKYCPSWSAAEAFTVLFAITTVAHILQACYYRKPFLWVLIMGAVWELVAASTRVASIAAPFDKNKYSTSFVFLVLAPLWINAFDYVVLGRMVWFYLPEKALAGIRATRISTIFVCLDISAFIVQLAGALMTVGNSNTPGSASKTATALHIYTAGVALQQTVILVFFGLGTAFLVKLLKRRDITAESRGKGIRLMFVLYASLLLITWRIIFRIIEFSAGVHTPLNNTLDGNEWFVYVFDIGPMFFALVLYHIYHPGRVLRGPEADYPSRAQRKATKRLAGEQTSQQEPEASDHIPLSEGK